MNKQFSNGKKSNGTKKTGIIAGIVGIIIGLTLIATGIVKITALERNAQVANRF